MTKFLNLDFKTTKDTFVPRPETGLLVETCLKTMNSSNPIRILDIGTGTGNIAISLTKRHKLCTIVALDVSGAALAVAKENAKQLGVSDRITFLKGDLFSGFIKHYYHNIDIIVSNPPYIPSWEIETLAEHVKDEPRAALDGGDDGLYFYRRIIEAAPVYLKENGYLILEMGYNQSRSLKKLLETSGNFFKIKTVRDDSNIKRVIRARWTSS